MGLLDTFGESYNERELKRYQKVTDEINDLEPEMRKLSDGDLSGKTEEFRERLVEGESLDDILPEAYAVVREASVRTIGMRHYNIQLIGGAALHEGNITEMNTGEGKTLAATLPLYLNALDEKGTHLITVNYFLARRDARWMGPIYEMLGMSVGVLQGATQEERTLRSFIYDPSVESSEESEHNLRKATRKDAYAADITYGANSEFGFDYLRDNMVLSIDQKSQRKHNFAILDEVDNVLIDEARTPHIISGPENKDLSKYPVMAQVVKQLIDDDVEVNEKDHTVVLTEKGDNKIERLLGVKLRDQKRPELITDEQAYLLGHLEQALRARYFFKRDKEYLVLDGEVIIVDEFTGRMMPGRRWSDGLHQAVEAKEIDEARETVEPRQAVETDKPTETQDSESQADQKQ